MVKTNKRWVLGFLGLTWLLLLVLCGKTALIDPYFHYHKPLPSLAYPTIDPRYQNNGILKNFDYDAIITGSSMAENFKTSELDALFGTNSVKVPLYGSTFREIDADLRVAIAHNSDIRLIFRCLDFNKLLYDADKLRYEESWYPTYLYDDNPFNDVSYLMNKTVLLQSTDRVLQYTLEGNHTPDFDEYCNWTDRYALGREAIDAGYTRPDKSDTKAVLSEDDRALIRDNVEQNLLEIARENPQITFYLFFTPYSIFYWDELNQAGMLERQLELEKYAIELLLPCENIRLFSFFDAYDMICDPDNYRDSGHYGERINSRMLLWMHSGEHRLTKENYLQYCDRNREFYCNYNYDALFDG